MSNYVSSFWGPPRRPPKCQAIWRKERSFKVTRRPVWVSRSRRRNVSDVLGQLKFGIRQKFGENFCWLLTKWKKNSTLFENFWRDDLQQLRVCRLHWPAKNIFICCTNSAKFAVISKQTATAAVSSVFREIDRVVKSKKSLPFLERKVRNNNNNNNNKWVAIRVPTTPPPPPRCID